MKVARPLGFRVQANRESQHYSSQDGLLPLQLGLLTAVYEPDQTSAVELGLGLAPSAGRELLFTKLSAQNFTTGCPCKLPFGFRASLALAARTLYRTCQFSSLTHILPKVFFS